MKKGANFGAFSGGGEQMRMNKKMAGRSQYSSNFS
jgi:hypothetical protein